MSARQKTVQAVIFDLWDTLVPLVLSPAHQLPTDALPLQAWIDSDATNVKVTGRLNEPADAPDCSFIQLCDRTAASREDNFC